MNPILYAKVGAVLLTIGVLFGAGFHFGSMNAKASLEDYKATAATALADAYVAQQKAAQAKQVAYEHEIDTLKTDSLTYPTIAVRMCPPSHPVVPETGAGGQIVPAGAGVGAADPIPVPKSDGPDYGRSLFGLADALDTVTAKCRSL